MDLEWMEEAGWVGKLKKTISLRHRLGDILYWLPSTGLIPTVERKPGISAMMRVKNEAELIEISIRSLAPFVEQFSIVDNGSDDGTPDIIRRVAEELSLDYVIEILPDADFGTVCDRALHNTTCRWVLRWDGDMIARTQSPGSFAKITEKALSLDPNRYYVIYFPHIQLDGDLFHQNPEEPTHHEDYLFTWSPALYHRKTGKFRELIAPVYYKRIFIWDTASFHLAGFESPENLLKRKYWVEWRALGESVGKNDLHSYALSRIVKDFGVYTPEQASALWVRERFKEHIPYDSGKYGDYPELLAPFLENSPNKLVYRKGRIAGRTDVMDILDSMDKKAADPPVDVIICTRNRNSFAVNTVRDLLKDDYPNYHIIVIDQSDCISSELNELAVKEPKLLYRYSPSRGLPSARNEGVNVSEAEIIIFVDDDIIPGCGFIRGHVNAYRDSRVGCAGGKIFERREERNQVLPSKLIGRVNFLTGEIYRGFNSDKHILIHSPQGVNMSFRRIALVDAGGFDERFGGAFLFEETDACLRVRKGGWKVVYTPEPSLEHIGAPSGGCRVRDYGKEDYWYAYNFSMLYLKHFPRFSFPVFFSFRTLKLLKDSILHRSPEPVVKGFKGIAESFRDYFNGE